MGANPPPAGAIRRPSAPGQSAGDRAGVTLAAVAREAGVSVSLVSRLLNNDQSLRLRDETRDRVHAAVRRLQYTPNHAGRSLRLARAEAIGLVIPDVNNPVFAEVLRGVQRGAAAEGAAVLIVPAESLASDPGNLHRLLTDGRVDGVVLQRADRTSDEDLRALLGRSKHLVLLNSRVPGWGSSVVLDNRAGASVATEALIARGHRDIAIVTGPRTSDTASERYQGYRETMTVAGLPVRRGWVAWSGYAPEDGQAGLRLVLSGQRRPTGLFVANVNAAIGVLALARELGLRVPEDLSVVALHESWMAQHTQPPLATVRMPLYELGRAAVEALHAELGGEAPVELVVRDPTPQLAVRESLGSL